MEALTRESNVPQSWMRSPAVIKRTTLERTVGPPSRALQPVGGRLLMVANRLPISVANVGNRLEIRPSDGGLATTLRNIQACGRTLMIGHVGAGELGDTEQRELDRQLESEGAIAVTIPPSEFRGFYAQYANGVL